MRNRKLLAVILAALPACSDEFSTEGCMSVPADQTTCPARDEVDKSKLFVNNGVCSDYDVREVTGDGTRKKIEQQAGSTEVCCYPIQAVDLTPDQHCVFGRPYLDGDTALRAPLCFDGDCARSERARRWAEAGAAEHASVASFSRLALQLLAHGAPPALVGDVHRAALDELDHTERCFRVAAELAGSTVHAGAFPFPTNVDVDISLAELAVAAVREGCLGETLCAHVMLHAAERSPDALVRSEVGKIADDEARHAALSFRIVAWALAVGDDSVRRAVADAFAEPWAMPNFAELALRANVDAAELQRVAMSGVDEVLEPAAARLLYGS